MAIQEISTDQLLLLSEKYPVLDVRSPGEYLHAHIPGAYNLPLFTDEERKIIGTSYKQESREKAIKFGLDFFGVKMRGMIEEVEKILQRFEPIKSTNPEIFITNPDSYEKNSNAVIVHCWRGGMRSASVAWLLNFYGFDVYLLQGGYKIYRNWVLKQFENKYDCNIIGGYTGSGKTELLHGLQKKGHPIIDLEGLANHKGSAFGALGQPPQPKQEMFENLLAEKLNKYSEKTFWLEDESQRIGALNIPHGFWNTMRTKLVFFIEIPFEQRLEYITSGYGALEKEDLINAIVRIKKRLGPMETKMAIGSLIEDNVKECFRVLLYYYDKTYIKGLQNRGNLSVLLNKIDCSNVDAIVNTEKIISCVTVNT